MVGKLPPFPGEIIKRVQPNGYYEYIFTLNQLAWLHTAFIELRMGYNEIASMLGVSRDVIYRRVRANHWKRTPMREIKAQERKARQKAREREIKRKAKAKELAQRLVNSEREKNMLEQARQLDEHQKTLWARQGNKLKNLLESDISNPDPELIQAKEEGLTNHSNQGTRNDNTIIGKCIGERCFLYGSWSCLIANTQTRHRKDCNALF